MCEAYLLFIADTGADTGTPDDTGDRGDVNERCAGVITSGRKTWATYLLRRLKSSWNREVKLWSSSLLTTFQVLRGLYWSGGKFPSDTILEDQFRRLAKPLWKLHHQYQQRTQFIQGLVTPELDDLDAMEQQQQQQTQRKAYCILSVDINRYRDRDIQDHNLGLCIHLSQSQCLFQNQSTRPVFAVMQEDVTALQLNISCCSLQAEDIGGRAGCSLCSTRVAEEPTPGFSIRRGHGAGVFVDMTCELMPATNTRAPAPCHTTPMSV